MKPLLNTLSGALALIAAAAYAQSPDIRPGLWEISLTGIGEVTQTVCVTPEMVKNMRELTMRRDPGSDCQHSNEKVSGKTRTFEISCTTPAQYRAKVRLTVDGPDRFSMTQEFTMDLGGQQQRGSATMNYRRVGECP